MGFFVCNYVFIVFVLFVTKCLLYFFVCNYMFLVFFGLYLRVSYVFVCL